MFGFFKKKDVCIEWLIKVDKVYIDALRSNNASKLERYFSRRCLGRVVEIVNSNRDNLCGLERYRDVAYTLQSKTDRQLIYLKITSYKNVNMGYGIVVPMGEAVNELWTIEPMNNEFIVTDIKGV